MATEPWIEVQDLEYPDDPEASEAVAAASFIVYEFSGKKYSGPQTLTEEYTFPTPRRAYGARCVTAPTDLRLRRRPVWSVNQVVANGRTLDDSEFEVFNGGSIRATRTGSWRLAGRITVTYTGGAYPPEAGKRAVRVLANELLKARRYPDQCRLPERVTSIAREGISMSVLDPQDFLDHGRTGIYEVDLFLKAANPSGALAKARVISPDLPRARRVSSAQSATQISMSIGAVAGVEIDKKVTWMASGTYVPLLGKWTPIASVYDVSGNVTFDLTPYIILEPESQPGVVEILVPDSVTATIPGGSRWALNMVRTANPSTVVKLAAGDFVIERV